MNLHLNFHKNGKIWQKNIGSRKEARGSGSQARTLVTLRRVGGGRLFEARRLLTFPTYRVGACSRWALIRGWALNRINTVSYKLSQMPSLFAYTIGADDLSARTIGTSACILIG